MRTAVDQKVVTPVGDDGRYLVVDVTLQEDSGVMRKSSLLHPGRNISELASTVGWSLNDVIFSVEVVRNRLGGAAAVGASSCVVFVSEDADPHSAKHVVFYAETGGEDFQRDVRRAILHLNQLGFCPFNIGQEIIRPKWVAGGSFCWEVSVPNPEQLPVAPALNDEVNNRVTVRMFFVPYEALTTRRGGILEFFQGALGAIDSVKLGRYAFTDEGVWIGYTEVKMPKPEAAETPEDAAEERDDNQTADQAQ